METIQSFTPAKITTALAAENVTETVIKKLQEYKKLVIGSLDDKEGYEAVSTARKECMRTRTLTVKICKKGRESAIEEQKAWVAKEKEITSQISNVENYLQDKETWFENENEKIRIRKEREQQFPMRLKTLMEAKANIPSDDIILEMDDATFINYLNGERERILSEREAAIKAKEEQSSATETIDPIRTIPVDLPNGPMSNAGWVSHPTMVKTYSDKEIITGIAEMIYNMEFPEVKSEEANAIVREIKDTLATIALNIANKAEKLNS